MKKLRWQDMVNIVLGLWLAISPWVLGYAETHTYATWNAIIAGLVIAGIEAIHLDAPSAWEEWTSLVIGLWLIVAPFALGLSTHPNASASTIAVGALVALFAAWVLWISKSGNTGAGKHLPGH